MTTANLPAPANLPPMIRLYAQSLSPQECTKHRAWIGVRVEALLDGYWQSRPSDLVKAEILADWMDALQNYAPEEIRAACREYLAGPDCARKPKPGDIKAIMQTHRANELARFRASQPAPQPEEPLKSPEEMEERRSRANDILRSTFGSRIVSEETAA